MLRKLILLLSLVFLTTSGIAQKLNRVVRSIAKHNVYEGPLTGFAGTASKQYGRFETLRVKAGIEKLITLATGHNNAVVRLYAFQALIFNKEPIPRELKLKFASDTSFVKILNGCIGGERKVNEIVAHPL